MDGEVWHLVEGRRDDGAAAIFRIRELAPRLELPRIFVVEMPYPITELSRLPDAAAYRRLQQFEEQWVIPACTATGYEQVGLKIEEGSFFLYMYGAADPGEVIARLAPFDAALGFYDDEDPAWGEYATLKELLDQAKAMPLEPEPPPLAASEPEPSRSRTATTVAPATRAATVIAKAAGKSAAKPAAAKSAAPKAKRKKSAAKAKPRATARPASKRAAARPASKRAPAKSSRARPTAKRRAKTKRR